MPKKLIIILLSIILLLVGAIAFGIWQSGTKNQSVSAAATRTGLVGWWTMDRGDTAPTRIYDFSGGNYHGVPTGFWSGNAPTSTQGKINQAISFDGKNGWINLGDVLDMDSTAAISISVWVKTAVTRNEIFVAKWDADAGCLNNAKQSYLLGIESAGRVQFSINSQSNGADNTTNGNRAINDNKWHNVVFTGADGSNNLNIYIDGSIDYTGTKNGTGILNSPTHLDIGNGIQNCAPTYPYIFDGAFDDIRVYDRVLSAQEVSTLYNSAKITYTASAPKKSLVGWWTMDSGDRIGNKILDKSGNNYILTSTYNLVPTSTPGKIKQAVSFNEVSLANPFYFSAGDVLDMDERDEVTLSAWIKTKNASIHKGVIAKWDAAGCVDTTQQSYHLLVLSDGRVQVGVDSDNTADNINITTLTVNDGKWHHIVLSVKDGTNNLNIYIDGKNALQATKSGTGIHNSPTDLRIGNADILCSGEENRKFVGAIDDVRIYNYALSAQEVANLYNSAKSNFAVSAPKSGLVGHWTMDNTDRSRNIMYDKSGLNNIGTLIGTTTSTGRIKEARSFNGSSDYISISNVDIAASGSTVSLWFKVNAFGNIIVGKNADNDTYIYPSNTTTIAVQTDVTTTVMNFTVPTMSTGVWYHLMVTRNSNTTRAYLNGVESSSGGQTQTDVMTINQIGRYGSGSSLWWSGSIDDVRIYNRALSAQEISNLYNSAKTNYK